MNEQLTLAPVHRVDPSESVEAARKVDGEHQLAQVLRVLRDAPEGELTDDQIAERAGLLRNSAGTRRGVARGMGFVERAGTGVTPRGFSCATWKLTDKGRVEANRL